jgi:hypothetical protein
LVNDKVPVEVLVKSPDDDLSRLVTGALNLHLRGHDILTPVLHDGRWRIEVNATFADGDGSARCSNCRLRSCSGRTSESRWSTD